MRNKDWYLFAMISFVNKEYSKESHIEEPLRNYGFDELKYLCRVFTNRFCDKMSCEECNFMVYTDDVECLILSFIKRFRGV